MDPTNETADYHPSTKEGGSLDHDDDCSTMSRAPVELPAVRLVAGRGETVDNSPPVAEGIASNDYRQDGRSRPWNLRNKKSKRGVKRERSASVAVNNNNHKHEPRGIPRLFSRIRPINDKTVDFGEESMTLVFDDMESSESTNTNDTGPGSHSSSELCANESFSSLSSSSSGSIGLLPNRWDLITRTFDTDKEAIKTTAEDGFKIESKKSSQSSPKTSSLWRKPSYYPSSNEFASSLNQGPSHTTKSSSSSIPTMAPSQPSCNNLTFANLHLDVAKDDTCSSRPVAVMRSTSSSLLPPRLPSRSSDHKDARSATLPFFSQLPIALLSTTDLVITRIQQGDAAGPPRLPSRGHDVFFNGAGAGCVQRSNSSMAPPRLPSRNGSRGSSSPRRGVEQTVSSMVPTPPRIPSQSQDVLSGVERNGSQIIESPPRLFTGSHFTPAVCGGEERVDLLQNNDAAGAVVKRIESSLKLLTVLASHESLLTNPTPWGVRDGKLQMLPNQHGDDKNKAHGLGQSLTISCVDSSMVQFRLSSRRDDTTVIARAVKGADSSMVPLLLPSHDNFLRKLTQKNSPLATPTPPFTK